MGLLEVVPQVMSWRPPAYCTRSKPEGLLSSESAADWVKISEMFLGPAPPGFTFVPKHKSSAYTLAAEAMARMVETAAAAGGAAVEGEDEGEETDRVEVRAHGPALALIVPVYGWRPVWQAHAHSV